MPVTDLLLRLTKANARPHPLHGQQLLFGQFEGVLRLPVPLFLRRKQPQRFGVLPHRILLPLALGFQIAQGRAQVFLCQQGRVQSVDSNANTKDAAG